MVDAASRFPWLPSASGAIAAAAFLAFHLREPWLTRGEPTPIMVPSIICLVLLVTCLLDVVISCRGGPDVEAPEPTEAEPSSRIRLAWYLGSLASFALLIEPLGFVGVVLITLPLLLHFGESLPLRKSLVVTAVTAAIVYVVFERLLAVDLPQGWFLAGLF
jgi:hypothetical protein